MKKIGELKKEWLLYQIDSLTQRGINKAEISRRLEILPQYLNSILKGDRGITDHFLDKFIEVFNINQIDLFEHPNTVCLLCREKDGHLETQRELIIQLKARIVTLEEKLNQPTIDIKKTILGE